MRVLAIRTAMIGGGLSYDVYVPVSECAEEIREAGKYRHCVTHIGRDSYRNGKHAYFINYPEATLPVSHFAMPQGWDRYDDYRAHEKKARREMLDIAESVFPELTKWREHGARSATNRDYCNELPLLWVTGLLKEETDSEQWVDVSVGVGPVVVHVHV